jgi:hypothetical protein
VPFDIVDAAGLRREEGVADGSSVDEEQSARAKGFTYLATRMKE